VLGLLARHFVRAAVFNGWIVGCFWQIFLARAERDEMLARLVNREMYRGTIFYHFLRGCADGDRRFGNAQPDRDPIARTSS